MRNLKFILHATVMFLTIACNPNTVFDEHSREFPNYCWLQNDTISFTSEIAETNINYYLSLSIRHVYGFNGKAMRVNLEIISPSNTVTNQPYAFKIVNAENNYLGDCIGDFCDLIIPIEENFTFGEKGKYTFRITHDMGVEQIMNVLQVGLRIDKLISD